MLTDTTHNTHKICNRKSIKITKRITHWYYILVIPSVQIYQIIQIVTLQCISLTATVAYSISADSNQVLTSEKPLNILYKPLQQHWYDRIFQITVLRQCFSCTETNHNTFQINLNYTGINLYGLIWPVIGCIHSKHMNEKQTHTQYVLILTCKISGSGTLTISAWDRNW